MARELLRKGQRPKVRREREIEFTHQLLQSADDAHCSFGVCVCVLLTGAAGLEEEAIPGAAPHQVRGSALQPPGDGAVTHCAHTHLAYAHAHGHTSPHRNASVLSDIHPLRVQIDSVEFAQMEKRIFDGLKAGNEVRPVPSLAERPPRNTPPLIRPCGVSCVFVRGMD
jgi:hypothetical protein